MENATSSSNLTYETEIDKYLTIAILVIGVPGNILSLIIWMQKRMRHSSGYYLAALAVNDLIFLFMAQVLDVHDIWRTAKPLAFPVICQLFPVIYLALQALSPCLVLAFTTERYISICHPFKREEYCTIRRAKIVMLCLTVGCVLLTAVNGYFFAYAVYEGDTPDCGPRASVLNVSQIYQMVFEAIAFFIVPMTILVLNVLVIKEMRRLSRMEPTQMQGGSGQRTSATTVMLLAVSFYQIITTLPISVIYALRHEFKHDVQSQTQKSKEFELVFTIIKEYGITHYAFNFIIYMITGKMFRQEMKRLFLRPFTKLASRLPRDYSTLRTSVQSSKQKTWVSVNGNGVDKEKTATNETLL
ncbi:growth hormone secretagogue receptor type 1 [Plakobranchus ocellatus]|uniref:Growth hormone secretagogue receptor type 1 n=1 Tax=Plakobranchus ocellatus TaxID=259542 RepID=A0AAV3Z799_9GAST|nr:growth hormone secretagogue receptor type 1 [Plakobranchus ocellatus]